MLHKTATVVLMLRLSAGILVHSKFDHGSSVLVGAIAGPLGMGQGLCNELPKVVVNIVVVMISRYRK